MANKQDKEKLYDKPHPSSQPNKSSEQNTWLMPAKKRKFLHSGSGSGRDTSNADSTRYKNPKRRIQITSGNQNTDTEGLKKGETILNLKALINEHVIGSCKIEDLEEKTKKLMSSDENIQGLETRMHALLHEFKKDKNEKKKDEAMRLGFRLSGLLSKIMYLKRNDEDMIKKFQVLKNSLQWVSEGTKSDEIQRYLDFLKFFDEKIWKKQKPKNKQELTKGRTARRKEAGPHQGREQENIDGQILLLLNEIFRLELFWMHQELLNSEMPRKDALPSLEAELQKCKKKIIEMEPVLNRLLAPPVDELNMMMEDKETEVINLMRCKLWNQLKKSRKAKKD
ncbi:conserved hypothetical protein [Ricinus communis]|uniref:Uncharacterized protein n=1 Tax=Ricinus communis TaxID=3988 RepID=B9S157_RICCO|nr:conserved hypothetical protein [Ricinus communis]